MALRSLIEQFLDDKGAHRPVNLTDEVKRTIAWSLRFGSASLDETAALLAIGSRSLQRKLRAAGTDFATLLAEVRTEITLAYFAKDPNRPIGQLTSLLRYSEPSAVSRFLKQQFGRDSRLLRQTLKS